MENVTVTPVVQMLVTRVNNGFIIEDSNDQLYVASDWYRVRDVFEKLFPEVPSI